MNDADPTVPAPTARPAGRPVGLRRHPGRHRAALDRRRVRGDRGRAGQAVVDGARRAAGRQRPDRLGLLHPDHASAAPTCRRSGWWSSCWAGWSLSCGPPTTCRGGRVPWSCWPALRADRDAVRPGVRVLPGAARRRARAAARGLVRRLGRGRRGHPGQAASRSRTSGPAPLLGVEPAACVVLEDSATGARSGNAAGAVVVGIPHVVAIPAAPRRVTVPTLAGLDPGPAGDPALARPVVLPRRRAAARVGAAIALAWLCWRGLHPVRRRTATGPLAEHARRDPADRAVAPTRSGRPTRRRSPTRARWCCR